MADYRLEILDDRGRVARTIELECRNDEHAREVVSAHAQDMAMELWQGERIVQRFGPGAPGP